MLFISIDPGTYHIGVVIWQLDNKLDVLNIDAFTIDIDSDKELNVRLDYVYNVFYDIFNFYKPTFIVHEEAFMFHKRPQAYGPIYTSIYNIRRAYRNVMLRNNIFSYSPKTIKMFINSGDAKKIDIAKGIKNIDEIVRFVKLEDYSEHAIDALAIGYYHLTLMRKYKEIVLL